MNRYAVFGLVLLISTSVAAQLTDTLSGLAIQGALTSQSTRSVAQGLSMLKRNRIMQDLTQTAMEIRISHPNGYMNVNTTSVGGQPFEGLDWQVGPTGTSQFYIQLSDIDMSSCRYLVSGTTAAKEVYVNGTVGTAEKCSQNNMLRFIFD